ncbi:MAG: uracil phosphoribosyltransferase [Bacteroidetes bacterium]|nr:uracil phosphoribosyltransferase [Bacteroidota bacterium]
MKKNVTVLTHPLIQRDLTILRNKNTSFELFRSVLHRISRCMAYEVLKDLSMQPVSIETPLAKANGVKLKEDVILIPILRAGLGLVNGFIELVPESRVGHIGMFRDERTLQPVEYYFKVPPVLKTARVLVLDPMLATGGSAVMAVSLLKKHGARTIVFVSLIAAPEGIRALQDSCPSVSIYTCAIDKKLNSIGYIVPGLGDAGDRIFGTK